MKKKLLTLLLFLFFTVDISTTSQANTDTKIIEGATKIIEGLGKIETATKGKKLQKFFSGNTLRLLIDEKTKEYKFQEKTYEVFEDGKSIESGKWKVSGLLKNQIKLNADGNSKAYYLKKINKKEILYHYDKLPGKKSTIKTLVTIEPLIKKEEIKVVKKKEEPKVEETKVVKKKKEKKVVKKIDDNKIKKEKKKEERKKKKKEKKNKDKEKKKKSKLKKKITKLSESEIKKLNKYKKDSVNIKIIESEDSYIQTTKRSKIGIQTTQYVAAVHCAKNNLFAYSFADSGYGVWYEPPFKRAKYFYCTKELIFINPFTGKEVNWTNYDEERHFEFPDKHLFIYRKMSRTYQKLFEKEKKNNPKKFKTEPFKIVYKDENSIHIKGSPLGDLNIERYLANEHCSKYNKKYYFFEDSYQQGTFGSISFHCSNKHMASNPFSGLPLQYVSGSENYSPESETNAQGNLNASQMLKYNSTNNTTFHFFEASDNLMKSLELLYRAYDKNVEADKLKAQISYNRQSKYSEQDKLESTRIIIGSSSKEINAQIVDASKILSDVGRGYYEQSLPYAYSAAQNSYTLIMTIRNTFEKGTQDTDSFLEYANEFIGFFAIAKDLPKLANDIFTTSRLVFSAAKSKKIKDKGNLGIALEELNLDV